MLENHLDVVVVGAGISGIGAAYNLQTRCPQKTFTILEGRSNFGGTWDLFKYPGVRSDSDMHTMGFKFKPWNSPKTIADGPAILSYLDETIEENDLRKKIQFNKKVIGAVVVITIMTKAILQNSKALRNLKGKLYTLKSGLKTLTTQIRKLSLLAAEQPQLRSFLRWPRK